jgi:hypothetical protein
MDNTLCLLYKFLLSAHPQVGLLNRYMKGGKVFDLYSVPVMASTYSSILTSFLDHATVYYIHGLFPQFKP